MNSYPQKGLSLEGSWSLSEQAFTEMTTRIRKELANPHIIVEFGSGVSSIRLALEFASSKVISIENHKESYEQTKNLAKKHLNNGNLEVLFRELVFEKYGDSEILSYRADPIAQGQKVDCVIIDGPSFYTLRGREACLYQIFSQINLGGLVILDDFRRRDEKKILNNWLDVYPSCFDFETLKVGHGLAVLKKIKESQEHWAAATKAKDCLDVTARYKELKLALTTVSETHISVILGLSPLSPGLKREAGSLIASMRTSYMIGPEEILAMQNYERTLSPLHQASFKLKKLRSWLLLAQVLLKGV